jgi:hypothetical protein
MVAPLDAGVGDGEGRHAVGDWLDDTLRVALLLGDEAALVGAGKHLYVAVGSNSNAAANGLDKEDRRASILEIDVSNGQSRVCASGLRNPVGMAWEAETGALWTAVNERDELGT